METKMEVKVEPWWLEEASAKIKTESHDIPASDAVMQCKVVPFTSHFVQETKCNVIYSNDQEKSTRIKVKEEPIQIEGTSDGIKCQVEDTVVDAGSENEMKNSALWLDERGKEPFPKQCPRYAPPEDDNINAEEQYAQQMMAKAGYTRLLALNRMRKFRQKLQEDPVKYAAHLAKERDRYKNRKKLRKDAHKLNPTKLEMRRLKDTLRQRAYRKKKADKKT